MIIITGISGFVGKNLSAYLKGKKMDISSLSLRDEDWQSKFPDKADAIIHLAGKAHDTSNTLSNDEYFFVNKDLTINLFNSFLKSDIRDFIYFSSVKAVADTVDGVLLETEHANPKTPYGISKLEAEKYLLSCHLPEGKRLFIIRPCMIHGPYNKGNLNLLYNVVKSGIPWPLASFENRRSFLNIDNLCFLIHELLDRGNIPSGIYNFADDDYLSTNDIVSLISKSLNKKTKLMTLPKSLIRVLVKIGDLFPLPINSERLKKLTESYQVSNAKIKAALGINKLPISVREGLEKTFHSFND